MNVDEIITLLEYIRDDDYLKIEKLFRQYLLPLEERIDDIIMCISDLKDQLPQKEDIPISEELDIDNFDQ